jgi:hypothetical protein
MLDIEAFIGLPRLLVSSMYSEMKRWILQSEDSTFASFSKAVVRFSKQTVCTLQSTQINKLRNFIRAKFILSPKISD